MVKHLEKVAKATKRDIVVGGLITSLSKDLGYDSELRRLHHMPRNSVFDIETCLSHIIIAKVGHNTYVLLIKNTPE